MAPRVTVYVLQPKDRSFLKLEWLDPTTQKQKGKFAKTDNPDKAERARADLEYERNNGLHAEPSRMTRDDVTDLYA